jgi:hypothetical protein
VGFHFLELFRCQLAGLGNDMLRNGQFADIVQQGGGPQGFHFEFGEV